MWAPSPVTAAAAESPTEMTGEASSTRIAVNGSGPPPAACIPASASVAVAVSTTGWLVQPPGGPPRVVTGSVLSTRSIAWPVSADLIPDSETATAWT